MEKQIAALHKLGLSDTEVAEVLACDKRIDKGEKLFELSPDQEKASKQARSVSRAPTVYKFQKRERKIDNDKRFLMDSIIWMLTTDEGSGDKIYADAVTLVNPEREATFVYNGKKYKITLSCPRN